MEHTALLAGNALLLPERDFAVRCSYVDYDGRNVLARWQGRTPSTAEEESAFVRNYCPLIEDGVSYLARYIKQVRDGKVPQHAM